MSLTFTINSLREYQPTVSKCMWEALLRNSTKIGKVKGETEDVMAAVDAPCSITLTPHWETNSMEISHEWIGCADIGDGIDRNDFLKFAVANSLLEYTGVITE